MKPTSANKWVLIKFLTLALLAPGLAIAQTTFGNIVVFGTSLSDPGNVFALTKRATNPPYNELDMLLVPDAPYATGGHHFSNGATWIEQYARLSGFAGDVRPAFQGPGTKATNYAVGGARARSDGINVNLPDQVNAFLSNFGCAAPPDALYVVEFGGNDIRDALSALAGGNDGNAIIVSALAATDYNIRSLYAAGARKFLVLNAPNLGRVPAIRILDGIVPGAAYAAELLSQSYNAGLHSLLGLVASLPGIQITELNLYQMLDELATNPGSFGLSEVTAACLTPNIPPFKCGSPDEFLFWDGIHPTKAVHTILAMQAAYVLSH